MSDSFDRECMRRAIRLAAFGQGRVEPNPMVGCVVARDGEVVGEGWHQRFGGPHAEVEAIQAIAGSTAGTTMYVTLEPCCHHGKTPPCTEAILRAGVVRVCIAATDPFPQVDGGGIVRLRAAGLTVETGLCELDSIELNRPYLKRVATGLPWVIAKWAMSLDGKIATKTGHSQWISCEQSREVVHQIRGRVDGILCGRGTCEADDPLLTARPTGPRTATRIVLDSHAQLSLESQLVKTAPDVPVLVAVSSDAPPENCRELARRGCEVVTCTGTDHASRLVDLLGKLGRRGMTNLLVEGGRKLLGCFVDRRLADEFHVFVAPKLIGGDGPSAVGGDGVARMSDAISCDAFRFSQCGTDIYFQGRVRSER